MQDSTVLNVVVCVCCDAGHVYAYLQQFSRYRLVNSWA